MPRVDGQGGCRARGESIVPMRGTISSRWSWKPAVTGGASPRRTGSIPA